MNDPAPWTISDDPLIQTEALPAVDGPLVNRGVGSSRWNGCGSNSAAKVLIRSASIGSCPDRKVCPTAKSSRYRSVTPLSPVQASRACLRRPDVAEPGAPRDRARVDEAEGGQRRAQGEEDGKEVATPAQRQPAAACRDRQPRQVRD